MEVLHNILNLLLPPITIIFLFLFYPFYLFIKLVIYLHKYLHIENVSGKVVLITGASSGIGENLTYEYAKKGANLALVALRKDENRLERVAERSRQLGSDNVIILPGDVSILDDCKKFVDDTILHFGKLDHLINNAGVAHWSLFENFTQIQDANPILDINFWGSAYITYFAIPHLRKTKGRIIVITSIAANIPSPVGSVYSASKAALLRLFETLRVELSPDIKVTIVLPGFVSTDMTTPHFVEKFGSDLILSVSVKRCAKAIFKGIGRGEKYITEPRWMKPYNLMKNACPEIVEYVHNCLSSLSQTYLLSSVIDVETLSLRSLVFNNGCVFL